MKNNCKKLCSALAAVCIVGTMASNAVVCSEAKADDSRSSYEYKMFETQEKYEEELKENMSRVYYDPRSLCIFPKSALWEDR